MAEIMMPNQPLNLWVHGLLSYLRPLDLYRSACDVSQLIEDALSALEPQRAAKEVEIALDLSRCRGLAADPLWLGQAFLAILTNALDTSRRDQCVAISSAADEAFVSVSIASGVQESPPSASGECVRSYEIGHVRRIGLGLTMAKRIVEAHRGHMALYSHADQGAMVQVHLPLLSTPLRF